MRLTTRSSGNIEGYHSVSSDTDFPHVHIPPPPANSVKTYLALHVTLFGLHGCREGQRRCRIPITAATLGRHVKVSRGDRDVSALGLRSSVECSVHMDEGCTCKH